MAASSSTSLRAVPAPTLHRRRGAPLLRLEKWYLDCVTATGGGVIGYAASLRLGPLSLRYSEALSWPGPGAAARGRTIRGGGVPTATEAGVAWNSAGLRLAGEWRGRQPAIGPVSLHAEPAGEIEWTCLCPAAETAVTLDGETYAGAGYAERLVMTLPPGRLPMRELRWGRFIADTQSCVWIVWRGGVEKTWCFHNGRAVEAGMPGPRELKWDGHRLALETGATLRSGCITDTALTRAGPLRWLLPRRVRRLVETKWCSRGVLTGADGRTHAGWAIHEVVFFP